MEGEVVKGKKDNCTQKAIKYGRYCGSKSRLL
jgi:hypothetical protein